MRTLRKPLAESPIILSNTLCEGDVLSWAGHVVTIVDVAAFAGADTYVTIKFLDRRGLPMSLKLADLDGATHRYASS